MDILSFDGWDITFCLDALCSSHKHTWSMPPKSLDSVHGCGALPLCQSHWTQIAQEGRDDGLINPSLWKFFHPMYHGLRVPLNLSLILGRHMGNS